MTLRLVAAAMVAVVVGAPTVADPDPRDWQAVLSEATGQTVYWYAWAGSSRTNDFITWASRQVADRFSVTVEHVKISDTAEAVSRVVAEKAAGRDEDGAVDLIWLNGENFAAMKEQGLLFGPWAEDVPNWRHVDVVGKPAVRSDFTVPTDGLELPWGMAHVVFYHDSARVDEPPRSIASLLDWVRKNPGRFTFPQPPDYLGSTFLKQALYELTPDPAVLLEAVDATDYARATAAFWEFMEALTPHLWRSGGAYPQSGPRQIQLMADGEIDLAISFNPNEPAAAIANFELPESVRTFVPERGAIGNASFVGIPYNASAKAGAMVLANFLLSPEAQAHKQEPEVWGNGTVLNLDTLSPTDRTRFETIQPGVAAPLPADVGDTLPEPHPSWMVRLEEDWIARFGVS